MTKQAWVSSLLLVLLMLGSQPLIAQEHARRHGFWGSLLIGYGTLHTSSAQETAKRADTFALDLEFGATLTSALRPGLEFNGWLLEAFSINDPSRGESLTQALLLLEVYPWSRTDLFIKGGVGRAMYTANDPLKYGSSGWGGTLGLGYRTHLAHLIKLKAAFNYSVGTTGDVRNAAVTIVGRRYHTFDLMVGIAYR